MLKIKNQAVAENAESPFLLIMSEMVNIRVIRDISEVEGLRSCWTCWQTQPSSDIDMYFARLKSASEVLRPHIFVLCRCGEPEALLVGALQRNRMQLRFGYWKFYTPVARILSFPYGGILGNDNPENARLLVRGLVSCLRAGEADVAVLRNIRSESPLYSHALQLPGRLSRDHVTSAKVHYRLNLPKTIEEVYQGLSKEDRKDIFRRPKKLIHDYGDQIRIVHFRTVSELEHLISAAEEVARKTYQRALGVGFSQNAGLLVRLRLAADKGWLRGYVLFISGRPCAYTIGSLFQKTFYGEYVGYDPDFGQYSPGTFLFMKVLEDLCAEGVQAYDFDYGAERYKQRFGNAKWWEADRIHVYSSTPKGIVLNVLRTSMEMLDRTLRKLLDRTELLPELKTTWRRRLKERQSHSLCTAEKIGATRSYGSPGPDR